MRQRGSALRRVRKSSTSGQLLRSPRDSSGLGLRMSVGLPLLVGVLACALAAYAAASGTPARESAAAAAKRSSLDSRWKLHKCGRALRIRGKRGRVRRLAGVPCPRRYAAITLPGPPGPAGPDGAAGPAGPRGAPGLSTAPPSAGIAVGFDTPPATPQSSVDVLIAPVTTNTGARLLIDARVDQASLASFDCPGGSGDCHLSWGVYVDGQPVASSGRVNTLTLTPGSSAAPDTATILGDPAGATLSLLSGVVAAGGHEVTLRLAIDAGSLGALTARGSMTAVQVQQ